MVRGKFLERSVSSSSTTRSRTSISDRRSRRVFDHAFRAPTATATMSLTADYQRPSDRPELLRTTVMEDRKYNESWSPAEHAAQAGTQDQSTPVPGDGPALHAAPGPPAASQAGAVEQPLPRDGRNGGRGGGRGGGTRNRGGYRGRQGKRRDRLGRDSSRWIRCWRPPRGARRERVLRARHGRYT